MVSEEKEEGVTIHTPATYAIVDQDHRIYTYSTLGEYLYAQEKFQKKWSKQVSVNGIRTSEFFEKRNFGGWKLTLSIGSIANLESTKYGEEISSLITAEQGRGTEVCMKRICQTYAPGLKINYVGEAWDNKITSLAVH